MSAADITTLDRFVARRNFFNFLGLTCRLLSLSGGLLYFVKMKAFKLKEDISVFTDASQREAALNIKARQIMDFSAAYNVTDTQSGETVGALKRKGLKSILRDEWEFWDPNDQVVAVIKEDSMALALLRRFLSNLIPQSYSIFMDDRQIGSFTGTWNPFIVKFDVDFQGDPERRLDRRLGVAAAVLLMCIEGKQR